MWITRGMFVPHIPPVTHTNPPPAHTTPGKVQGYSDSFSITEFFQKTRWETRIDPNILIVARALFCAKVKLLNLNTQISLLVSLRLILSGNATVK